MTWKATVEEEVPVVPEGQYNAMPTDIQDMDGPHGAMVRVDFTLTTDDEYDGLQVSGLASKKLSENTKLGHWVAAILGRIPEVGEEILADGLLHRDCRVAIEH